MQNKNTSRRPAGQHTKPNIGSMYATLVWFGKETGNESLQCVTHSWRLILDSGLVYKISKCSIEYSWTSVPLFLAFYFTWCWYKHTIYEYIIYIRVFLLLWAWCGLAACLLWNRIYEFCVKVKVSKEIVSFSPNGNRHFVYAIHYWRLLKGKTCMDTPSVLPHR